MSDAAAANIADHLGTIAAALLEQNRLAEETNKRLEQIAEKLGDLEPVNYFTDRDGCLMVHLAESRDLKRIGDQVDNMARAIDGLTVARR